MAYKLVLTNSFEKDLDEIIGYISNSLYNKTAARKLYREVKDKLKKVCEQPKMFPLRSEEELLQGGYRSFVVGNYIVFYTADSDKEIVYAQMMIYGYKDIENLLR